MLSLLPPARRPPPNECLQVELRPEFSLQTDWNRRDDVHDSHRSLFDEAAGACDDGITSVDLEGDISGFEELDDLGGRGHARVEVGLSSLGAHFLGREEVAFVVVGGQDLVLTGR